MTATTESKTPKPTKEEMIPILEGSACDTFHDNGGQGCACIVCGKKLGKGKLRFVWTWGGGSAFPARYGEFSDDCWIENVGPECAKKFPKGYVLTEEEV